MPPWPHRGGAIAGKTLAVPQVKALLAGKTTGEIKRVRGQSDKASSARLHLNLETQRVDFVFGTPDAHRKTDTPS